MMKSFVLTDHDVLLSGHRLRRTALGVVLAVIANASPVLSAPPAQGMTTRTLANGLQVVLVEDHWHPLVALEVCYRVGARNDPPGKQGLAHLLEHLTFHSPGSPHAEEVTPTERLVRARATTNRDTTCYSARLLRADFEKALTAEAARMATLQVRAKDLEREQAIVMKERRQLVEGDTWRNLLEEVDSVAFRVHPYRFPTSGWPEPLAQISLDDVRTHFAAYYSPANAVLVAVGDFRSQDLLASIEATFGQIPTRPLSAPSAFVEPTQGGERRILLAPLAAPRVVAAYHVPAFGNSENATLEVISALLVVEKHEAPVVAVTLLVKHGATSDPPDRRGVAFLTGRLLTEGTRQRSGDQLAERLAALGGEFVADVSFDFTTLDWAVLKEDLTPALELLADIVQHSVFPAKEVERERKATLADLQVKTAETSQALLLRHFFGTGPYGLPVSGDAASLGRIGQPEVVQFHRQAYRPAATILAAAGDVTLEELETLAQQDFGIWSATVKAEETFPALSVKREPAALVINRPLAQASVRLAFVGAPAANPNAPALLLLSHLLEGSAESRLGQNLRERKTWVYNVRSAVATFRQTGLFSIDMSVPYAVLLPALQETVHEIARLQTEPVSAAELERAKQEVATHFYFDTESVRDIARFLAEHEAYTQGREPPDHVLDALRSVTADEVQRVARTYLDPQGAVAMIEGDPQALRKYAPVLVQGKLPQWDLAPSGKSDGERRESTSSTDQTGR